MLKRHVMMGLLALGFAGLRPSALPAQTADARDVLNLVPADAWGFVVVPDVQAMNESLVMLQTQMMGMAHMDPLQMMTAQMGISKGLDAKGSAVIVVMDIKKHQEAATGPTEPPIAIIAPTTDPAEFLSNFSPSGEEDGVTKISIAQSPAFAAVHGKHVALSPVKAVVKAIGAKESLGPSLSAPRRSVVGENKILIGVAVSRIMEAYKDEISQYSQMGAGVASMMLGSLGAPGGNAAEAIDKVLDRLRQVEWLDVGFDPNRDGFEFTLLFTPKTGSELAASIKATKTSSDSLLRGLPATSYVLAIGALCGHEKSTEKFEQSILDGVLNNPAFKDAMDPVKFKAFLGEVGDLWKLIDRTAISISSLPEGPDGALGVGVVMDTPDSQKLTSGIAHVFATLKTLPTDPDGLKDMEIIQYKTAAETVGAAKVDVLSVDLSKASDRPDEDDVASFKKVMGQDAFSIRIAATDAKHVVVTWGGGKSFFTQVADSASKDEKALAANAGIQRISGKLPGNRTWEAFVAVDALLQTINRVARAAGDDPPLPAKLPKIGAPVAIVMSASEGLSRFDLVVPADVITGIRDLYMSVAQAGAAASTSPSEAGDKPEKPADEDEDDDKEPERPQE